MALAQRSGRSRHRLVLLLLTAATFLTLDFRDFGPLDTAQSAVRDLLEPVASVVSTVVSPVGDVWNGLFDYDDLEAENEALRVELEELRGEQLAVEAEREELDRLKRAVDIEDLDDREVVIAEVVRGPVGNFDPEVVTINKGERHGLARGMAVRTAAGLVGSIDQVDASISVVRLLSDPDTRVGVRLVGIDEVGLARSVAGSTDTIVVDQGLEWPADGDPSALPEVGSVVVTTGSGTSAFPGEIPVGTVAARTTEDDLTMIVDVELSADLDDLSFVTVILDEPVDQVPLDENPVPRTTLPVAPTEPADGSDEPADEEPAG